MVPSPSCILCIPPSLPCDLHLLEPFYRIEDALPLHSPTILLKFPVTIVEGADLTRFEPPRNAVEVKGVL